jgi:hypothetical protein
MKSKVDEVTTLSTGVKAIVRPVPAYLVDKMVSEIKVPNPPKQFDEVKQREEENPFDPVYLKQIEDANREKGLVTMEAMIMWGIELVDGIPDPDEWLPRLEWMAKRSELDLSVYDLDDPLDLEFVYKAFIATSGVDLMMVTIKSGMQNEEVELAMRGFRGDEEPSTDQPVDTQVQG